MILKDTCKFQFQFQISIPISKPMGRLNLYLAMAGDWKLRGYSSLVNDNDHQGHR